MNLYTLALSPSFQSAARLKSFSTILYTILIIIAVIVPALIYFLQWFKLKKLRYRSFEENGVYVLNDPNLGNSFESIRKEDNELVFIANEFTKKAFVSIVFSRKFNRVISYNLDFSKGRTVSIPIPSNCNELLILAQSVNGVKVINDVSIMKKAYMNLIIALVPTLAITICCFFETVTFRMVFTANTFNDYEGGKYFFLSLLPLLIGFPAIFVPLQILDSRVKK